MTEGEQQTVVIVEDEPAVAEGYQLWLDGEYETEVATNGEEALSVIDDDADVVMLDRMMPDMAGEEVLAELREREIDCGVVMVTAVEPDFDVVEMGFDAYITKPPDREELLGVIEQLVERSTLSDELQEYYSLMARKGSLEAEKTAAELSNSEAYDELLDRIEAQRGVVDTTLGDVDDAEDFADTARELFGEPEGDVGEGFGGDEQ